MAYNADTLTTLAPTPEPPIKRLDASLPVPPCDPARYMGVALNGMVDVNGLETLLSTKDAAAVLRLSCRTLEDLRWKGRSPPYLQLSRNCIRYRHCDLIEWAVTRTVQSTTEAHFRQT